MQLVLDGGLICNIRILIGQELRKRGEAELGRKYLERGTRQRKNLKNFELNRVNWLSDRYVCLYGLRKWTWRVIIEGIISENMRECQSNCKDSQVNIEQIWLVWYTFLKVAGIYHLDSAPNIKNANGPDTKAALFMYSMECFLFRRLNKVVREKNLESIITLGPYAALISRIIKKKSNANCNCRIQGEFTVFRGLSLPNKVVEKWKK